MQGLPRGSNGLNPKREKSSRFLKYHDLNDDDVDEFEVDVGGGPHAVAVTVTVEIDTDIDIDGALGVEGYLTTGEGVGVALDRVDDHPIGVGVGVLTCTLGVDGFDGGGPS